MADIKLKLDLIEGTLEVECTGEDFDAVIARSEAMLEKYKAAVPAPTQRPAAALEEPEEPGGQNDEEVEVSVSEPKPKRKRGKGTAKVANWKPVDNLLSEEQRTELREFYAQKAPSKQNDQVAVLAHKLKEMLGRDGFDGNEIYTAFQVVGTKTPANLTGVFGNMSALSLGKVVDKKWTPNFKSNDLVNLELPAKAKAK